MSRLFYLSQANSFVVYCGVSVKPCKIFILRVWKTVYFVEDINDLKVVVYQDRYFRRKEQLTPSAAPPILGWVLKHSHQFSSVEQMN